MFEEPTAANGRNANAPNPWAALIETHRLKRNMAPNAFARYLDDGAPTRITSVVMTRWRDGSAKNPGSETVIHVARRLDIPATVALRAAGRHELADYIERVTARDGTGPEYLEPLIARVRSLTDGLTDEQRRALQEDLLRDANNWFTLAEVKAQRLRDKDANPDTPGSKRSAS